MKKEHLALAIVIICIIGSVIGLTNVFKSSSKQNKPVSEAEQDSDLINILDNHDRIAIIRLDGVISDIDEKYDVFLSTAPAAKAMKYLNKAAKDSNVKAVILRINSPGGTVAASQELYRAVINCKAKKPVVVSMSDVAASGGYYVSSAADVIVANPGTLTGSIGVIINAMDFSKLFSTVGVQSNVIKTGKFKDIGSSFRPMSAADKKLLHGLINNTYEQFVNDVIEGRLSAQKDWSEGTAPKLTDKRLRENADGRIFTGMQAKEIGLVDELGGIDKASEIAIKLAQEHFKGVKDTIPVEVYDKPQSLSEYFTEMTTSIMPKSSLNDKIPFSVSHSNIPLWVME